MIRARVRESTTARRLPGPTLLLVAHVLIATSCSTSRGGEPITNPGSPSQVGTFSITAPVESGQIQGATTLKLTVANNAVASVQYLLNGRPLYKDNHQVGPMTVAEATSFAWHSANLHNGEQATLQAVGLDASGHELMRSAPVSFRAVNPVTWNGHAITPTLSVTPDLASPLSGTIAFQIHSSYALQASETSIFTCWVDGQERLSSYVGAQVETFSVDTATLPDGEHELACNLTIQNQTNPQNSPKLPVLAALRQGFQTSNGAALMELRPRFSDVYLLPGETADLVPSYVRADGTSAPAVDAALASASASVATVSGTTITAVAAGTTKVTVTGSGKSSTVNVNVVASRAFPHFTKSGGFANVYTPGQSMWVRSLFALDDNSFRTYPDFASRLKSAGVNTLNSGFYLSPGTGGYGATLAAWETQFLNWNANAIAADAKNNGFSLLLRGEDMVGGGYNLGNSIGVYGASYGPQAVQYAMTWAKNTGVVLGISMDDEVDTVFGSTPFPGKAWTNWSGVMVPANGFTTFMSEVNAVPRPAITWPCVGASSASSVANWNQLADYTFLYYALQFGDFQSKNQASTWQMFDQALDFALNAKIGAAVPGRPVLFEGAAMGPFYVKKSGSSASSYVAGTDLLMQPGYSGEQTAAMIMWSVARGLAGTVLYSWDVPGMDAGRASSPSGTVLENPVNPYVGGEMSTARWNGISGAFGLIQAIEPFVLQPATHAPNLGAMITTGAKSGAAGTLVLAINKSEVPRTVSVDLSPYGSGKITRYRVLNGPSYASVALSGTSETITLAPSETVVYTLAP